MVSVIIPTFNRGALIKKSVESVLGQSHRDFELIVVDDGSTDETAKVLNAVDGSFEVIRQENSGVSAARNRGIEAGRGEWFAFLDSDDLWKPAKLEEQMKWMRAHPQMKISQTDEIWIRNGIRVNPMKKHAKPSGWIFEKCLPFCVVSPSAVMIHRSLFEAYGLFDESLPACEDYELWLRLASKVPFGFIPQKLVVKYGGHADQLSKKHWGLDRFRVRALYNLLESKSLNPEQTTKVQKTLGEKCRILSDGSRKRGKLKEAETYLEMAEKAKEPVL